MKAVPLCNRYAAGMLGLAFLMLAGCAGAPNALNYVTADALDYGHVASRGRPQSAELSKAIQRISQSPEHRRMQAVLADLPADMTRCMVIEMADIDAAVPVPAVFAMFQTAEAVGFMCNFSFDGDGNASEAGGGWRAVVVDAPDNGDSLFPDLPADILPVTDPTTRKAARTVVIVTLAIPHHVMTIADWADGQLDVGKHERMIDFVPPPMRAKLSAGKRL